MNEKTFDRRAYAALVAATGIWCALIIAAPLFASASPNAAAPLYQFFSQICHQLDARLFHVAGQKLGVCVRCSSIYFSFFLTVLALPFIPTLAKLRPASSSRAATFLVPMAIDVALDAVGIHQSTLSSRVVTGALAGWILALLVVPHLLDAVRRLMLQQNSYGELHATKT